MFTREEFEQLRIDSAKDMQKDLSLIDRSKDVIFNADKYRWIHQTNWFGEPSLQLPQDLFAIQEIIVKTRPTLIVELGTCWGGTSLFCSSVMKAANIDGAVVGIDLYVPQDLRKRILEVTRKNTLPKINFFEGDTIKRSSLIDIYNLKNVLVILDSHHTHEHVLNELNTYSPYLNVGNYMVVCDTMIEDMPQQNRKREWGKGNNPRTALNEFLKNNPNFKRDEYFENKLLLSCQPDGYIKRVA